MRKSLQGKCCSRTGMDRYLTLLLQRIKGSFPTYVFTRPFTGTDAYRLKPPRFPVILLEIMRDSQTFQPGGQLNRTRDVSGKEKV